MLINTETRKKVKQNLPRGYSVTIGERLKVNASYVRQVANGFANSDSIFQELVKLALENQNKIKETANMLDQLEEPV